MTSRRTKISGTTTKDDEEEDETLDMNQMVAFARESTERDLFLQQLEDSEETCTYDEGAVTQAIWACVTCYEAQKQEKGEYNMFGVCAACVAVCHKQHVLYELLDKRNFRCDCGTPRSSLTCSFGGNREEDNLNNTYNQNFNGIYCWCRKPYRVTDGTMFQCFCCEDWFHEGCIANRNATKTIPDPMVWTDFLCIDCARSNNLFARYTTLLQEPGEAKKLLPPLHEEFMKSISSTSSTQALSLVDKTYVYDTCILPPMPTPAPPARNLFFTEGWRKFLCRCPTCRTRLVRSRLEFLLHIQPEDSSESDSAAEDTLVPADESSFVDILSDHSGSETPAPPSSKSNLFDPDVLRPHPNSPPYDPAIEDSGMAAFLEQPRIDHAVKIDTIRKFCELSRKLRAFIRKEVIPRDCVVTKEDIKGFFASEGDLPKRQRLD